MTRARWAALRAKGWREGGAADFLGLTPEEAAYVELKLRLSAALRTLRKQRGLTQLELARRLGSSQSRVAKMEAGEATVSVDLLTRSLLALGASRRDIGLALGR